MNINEWIHSDLSSLAIILGILVPIASVFLYQRRKIKSLKKELDTYENEELKSSYEIINDVIDVQSRISSIIKKSNSKSRKIEIDNLGLDLETVVPVLKTGLHYKNIDYRSLIINPESEHIKKSCTHGSNPGRISSDTAKINLQSIKSFLSEHELITKKYKLKLDVVSYDFPPVMHGFLLDGSHLFIALTYFKNEKDLFGGNMPYLYIKRNNRFQFNKGVFLSYETWFTYLWSQGKKEI